jgi:hypothetical protein
VDASLVYGLVYGLSAIAAAAATAAVRRSAGQRVGYADQILGFDCGGQQWVLEVAFPIGSYSKVTSSWRTPNT